MAWTDIFDIPTLLHNMGTEIINIPMTLFKFLFAIIYTLMYPIGVIINFVQVIFAVIYNATVPFINLVILMVNIPVLVLLQFIILPPAWTVLLYISIAISMMVRIYHWVMTIWHLGNPIGWILGTIGGRD